MGPEQRSCCWGRAPSCRQAGSLSLQTIRVLWASTLSPRPAPPPCAPALRPCLPPRPPQKTQKAKGGLTRAEVHVEVADGALGVVAVAVLKAHSQLCAPGPPQAWGRQREGQQSVAQGVGERLKMLDGGAVLWGEKRRVLHSFGGGAELAAAWTDAPIPAWTGSCPPPLPPSLPFPPSFNPKICTAGAPALPQHPTPSLHSPAPHSTPLSPSDHSLLRSTHSSCTMRPSSCPR